MPFRLILPAVIALLGASFPAMAQSKPVAWQPGYVGSCGGCNLAGRNMSGWTLSGANYREANLEFAFMRGIQATSTNFEGANASGVDLPTALLTAAHFSDAILTNARLMGVQASGA